MSAAAPPADAAAAAPPKKGKKKLIIIIAVVVLLLVAIGVGAVIYMKKKAAKEAEAAAAEETSQVAESKSDKPDLKHPPTFVPLDPFVVNLADRDVDRYAQIGITLEVEDAHFAEDLKAFMPAIRNGILMILSHKTSRDLLERSGKEQLAAEILADTSRTMGFEVEDPEPAAAASEEGGKSAKEGDEEPVKPKAKAKAKSKKKAKAEPNPIRHVEFSNFIIQ